MDKKIILISSITVILGLWGEFNEFFLNMGLYSSEILTHWICPNLILKIYSHELLLWRITEKVTINCANMLIYITLTIGIIHIITSKKNKSNLIFFAFSILFLYNFFSLTFGQFFGRIPFSLISSLTWTVISFIGVKLSKNSKALPVSSQENKSVERVPKYIRALHFVFDPLCFTLIIFEFNYAFEIRGLDAYSSVFYILVCYIISELVYGATPFKVLTNTTVVDLNGNKLKHKNLLLRNIMRFVPFDFVSYIFTNNGWHDKYSKSTVIKNG